MPLPEGFSPWEHLQTVLMQSYNRVVRDEFNDVGDDDDITIPRGSLRVACTIRDDDSIPQSFMRMMLFYFVLRKAQDLQTPVYGIPTDTYQQSVKFRPQVKLFFREDLDDVETGYKPIEAEISFRLVNELSGTINQTEALRLARILQTEFTTSNGFRWQKGRLKVSYKKPEQGYSMVISAYSEAEGIRVIRKVLDIQNHAFDDDCLTVSHLGDNPPIVPPTEFIYGQSRRLPRRRPVGWVRFQYAELHLWGMQNAIILVDRTGFKRTALIHV